MELYGAQLLSVSELRLGWRKVPASAPQCSRRIKLAGWAACQWFLLSRPSATGTNGAMCMAL